MKINFMTDIFGKAETQENLSYKRKDLPPGSACYTVGRNEKPASILFICPCGCGEIGGLHIDGIRGWTWDQNKEEPTLTPSIKMTNCGWHGYLTKGEWITA